MDAVHLVFTFYLTQPGKTAVCSLAENLWLVYVQAPEFDKNFTSLPLILSTVN